MIPGHAPCAPARADRPRPRRLWGQQRRRRRGRRFARAQRGGCGRAHRGVGRAKRSTTLGITVTKVRKGIQQELKDGGFTLDPDEQARTPYYVDMRIDNQGSSAIGQRQFVSMEDGTTPLSARSL
jgi:hypothetical protein